MAAHRVDLTGQRFGRLLALEPSGLNEQGKILWLCRCDCGNEIKAPRSYLTGGSIHHCGCPVGRAAEKAAKRRRQKTAWQQQARAVEKAAPPIERPNNGPIDQFLYGYRAS
jgi:hypothetical protein